MSWLQLSAAIPPTDAEAIESVLLDIGACSVTLQDNQDEPILEPGVGETPLWQDIKLTALFSDEFEGNSLLLSLYSSAEQLGLSLANSAYETFKQRVTISPLEDKAWEREWLNHFKPIACGDRLWIYPSWEELPSDDKIKLLLDPGLAFGTGTHETTLLCLQWLDRADVLNNNVLDFGCGSGILGIAALLLGAEHAVFVDNDPQALVATQANLEKNGVEEGQFTLVHADDYSNETHSEFELVLANILAKPLIELAPTLLQATKPNGSMVLSGLQINQQETVALAYANNVSFNDNASLNDWVRLSGVRHA